MSDGKTGIARRPLLASLGALLGVGVLAAGYEAVVLLRPHRGHTAYEDLLSRLPDRDNAVVLGAAVLAEAETFDTNGTARRLRERLGKRPLAEVLDEDLAQQRLVETEGWVLPETLALLCALCAKLN